MINEVLRGLSEAQTQLLYNMFNMLFWVVFSIALLIYINREQKLSKIKIALVLVIPYAVDLIIVGVAGIIKTLTASVVFFPTYYPVYFVPIMLATSAVISFVIKMDLAKVMDKFILAFFLARPCHCLACLCYGCCHGVIVDWGLYSCTEDANVIPLRFFEIIFVLAFWVINRRLYVNQKFKYRGQCAAQGTIEFGVMMVMFDRLCTTPSKFFLSLSMVGITAWLTIVAGLIMLHVFSKEKQPPAKIKHNQTKKRRK